MKTKLIAITLAFCLVLALPATSFAIEGGIASTSADEPITSQTITYSWFSDGEKPDIPDEVDLKDGGLWRLVNSTEPRLDENYKHPYQDYSQTLNAVVKAGDEYKSLFPQTIDVDEEYLKGQINLDGFDVVPGYNSNTAQVERTHVFENVAAQELDDIPVTYEFKVKSDSAVGAKATKALELSEADYKITAYDDAGKPSEYTVIADYRGQEDYLSHTYDTVNAKYSGRVTDTRDRFIIEATYEFVPTIIATPVPLTQMELSGDAVPLTTVLAIAAGIIIVLAALWALLWTLLIKRNARLVTLKAPQTYSDLTPGDTLKSRYLKVVAGECNFIIPSNLNIFTEGDNYFVVLKPSLANKNGVINVIWRDQIVMHAELQEVIRVDIYSMVTAAAQQIDEEIIAAAIPV